jgi:small subunit ribosomal protein S6
MKYELMVILSPKQTDKEIEKNLKEIKGILSENGFETVDEDLWGMREMAYRIKGSSKGYYAVYNFAGEPAGLPEVQKDLNLQTGVLRYMTTKVPDDYVMLRYDQLASTGKAAKLSSPAEELTKKVRSKKSVKTEEAAETPENTEKLDASLKAIIEDKDL